MRIKSEFNQRLTTQNLQAVPPKPLIKREQKLVRKLFERDVTAQMFKPGPVGLPPDPASEKTDDAASKIQLE